LEARGNGRFAIAIVASRINTPMPSEWYAVAAMLHLIGPRLHDTPLINYFAAGKPVNLWAFDDLSAAATYNVSCSDTSTAPTMVPMVSMNDSPQGRKWGTAKPFIHNGQPADGQIRRCATQNFKAERRAQPKNPSLCGLSVKSTLFQ
jgi:hypothetical protein